MLKNLTKDTKDAFKLHNEGQLSRKELDAEIGRINGLWDMATQELKKEMNELYKKLEEK